MARLRTLKF